MTTKETSIYILRWIGVIPVASIASFLVSCFFKLQFLSPSSTYIVILLVDILQNAVFTGSFVYLGALTAPKYNFVVAIILGLVITVICLGSLIIGYVHYDYSLLSVIIDSIAAIAGTLVSIWAAKNDIK